MHYVFKIILVAELKEIMSSLELFALLVAAVCHDCDHRGFNNAFEVMSRSDLALRYNDKSPLENHHCAVSFEVALRGPHQKANIFATLERHAYSTVREKMIKAILATDMEHHGDLVRQLHAFDLET